MDAVFAQLADFPWFVESSDREAIERLLAAPVVPLDSFLLRPCASRKALAISYKAARPSVGFELVHTRVRLDPRQQMWSVDNSNRHFPTISKLVQSLRLTPIARPLPVALRVDIEPLKLTNETVFVDTKWTVREFLDHIAQHLFADLVRDQLAVVRSDAPIVVLIESAPLLDASAPIAANLKFLVKGAAARQPPSVNLTNSSGALIKPIYDIIPSLNDAIDRSPRAAAAAAATASSLPAAAPSADTIRRRPDLPSKTGVEYSAPAAPAVLRAAVAARASAIDGAADDDGEEKVRIVSGAFFEDLLSDLNAIEFEAAAARRESGQFDVAAGFDALLNDAELCGDLQIDTQTIQSKKLNTLFDLIDEEDEAAVSNAAQ